ncbi:benzoate/H(+) symporter BenE family transporter [Leifsonia sp. H3M29-4]|uniref:benzoate/H(+) symporter BenE family transporter n=1 Tax=Salinibacterium metalliresistens TaxID=3031321 RepID=UPI0023DA2938|nr:benzoate/H(+) symporter BenE family transporter [Salinibacterium metalliresistens]MDF1478665.1 benzoate/H(+) symporter BenE family transporter [Salinibacterium metalliresistens]
MSAGFIAAISGFASSFALVIAGLQAVGASPAEAASGLFAVCLAIAITSVTAALWLRMPLAIAWSTPGAAVLLAAGSHELRFSDVVGAFLVSAALMLLCGLVPALGRAITRIPRTLASAMLAGVLLPICLAPVEAVATMPLFAAPIVLVWLVLFRLAPRWAVPAAMLVAIVAILIAAGTDWLGEASIAPQLTFVAPTFDPFTILSVGLPLFIATMAGQNIPGFAVMSTYGYTVPPRFAFVAIGLGSGAGALAGGHSINLGAITAAIMAGPEGGEDRNRRWIGTLTNGLLYVPLGMGAGIATALIGAAPTILVIAVAGLAVLGALITSITNALEEPEHRVPAIVTFLVVVSGVVVLGIGSALWGLLAGALVMAWLGWVRRPRERE